MDFLEKDLEEIICNSDREMLLESGLEINGKLFRQKKIGNYGVADLIGIERVSGYNDLFEHPYVKITVYELKKDKIGISAFLQALGYLNGIKEYLLSRHLFRSKIVYGICLIGRSFDTNSTFCYLSDFLYYDNIEGLRLDNYTYKYELYGLTFNHEHGYKLTDRGF